MKLKNIKMMYIKDINIIELYKLILSLFLLCWAIIGYRNIYIGLLNLSENSKWRSIGVDYMWTFGAVNDSNGTNPRIIFYGILIFSSVYLLSKIKSIKK
jgi:hypothetical protein